jgi:Gp157 protein
VLTHLAGMKRSPVVMLLNLNSTRDAADREDEHWCELALKGRAEDDDPEPNAARQLERKIMDPLLSNSLAVHEYIRDYLRREFSADGEALNDTLEGLSELPAILAATLRSHLDDLALISALRARISDMHQRLGRIEARSEKKRGLVASVMERADIKKLTQPDFTASLREVPPGLVVIEEGKIPAAFWKPQPPKLDRKALLMALKAGEVVAGAVLGNGSTTLAVRTR